MSVRTKEALSDVHTPLATALQSAHSSMLELPLEIEVRARHICKRATFIGFDALIVELIAQVMVGLRDGVEAFPQIVAIAIVLDVAVEIGGRIGKLACFTRRVRIAVAATELFIKLAGGSIEPIGSRSQAAWAGSAAC